MSRIKNITFLKAFLFENNLPPIYNKVGKDGDCYLEVSNNSNFTKSTQVLKVKDVPDYLDIELAKLPPKTAVNKVKTIKGHLVELKSFRNITDYLAHTFSTKSRSNFRRYQNRLETCFNITYICYFGDITKQEYNRLFVVLKDLLIRRFKEKQEANYELQHLEEFHSTVYNLILNRKASLFVIYDDNKPISIRINLYKKQIAYYMISGYDIDYSKFHLGTLDMLKNIEWCMNNNFEVYDLLKGYDYYKTKWATKSHYYYNHIAYNYNRIGTLLIGKFTFAKENLTYRLYNFFKKHHLISKFKKYKKSIFGTSNAHNKHNVTISVSGVTDQSINNSVEIHIEDNNDYAFLKRPVYDFLFTNNESINNVTIYKLDNYHNQFKVKSKHKSILITVNGI